MAIEGVGTRSTIEIIVCIVAHDGVVEGVAVAVDRGGADKIQRLEIITQGKGDRRIHRIVSACSAIFRDGIPKSVDTKGVVAVPPVHAVIASLPVQVVVAFSTGKGIIADTAIERIVSRSTKDGVVAAVAKEEVVACVAHYCVVDYVAVASCIGGAEKSQVFNPFSQDVFGGRRKHCIKGAVRGRLFRGDVRGVVDIIDVVAGSSYHGVDAESTVEDIVAWTAIEGVVTGVSKEGVVAGIAPDSVSFCPTRQVIIARGTINDCHNLSLLYFDIVNTRDLSFRSDKNIEIDV